MPTYTGENLRVGGEGRHFDREADTAERAAQRLDHRITSFIETVGLGVDMPPTADAGSTTVAEYLTAPEAGSESAMLFEACHLTQCGRYEAGSKALLAYICAVAKRFAATGQED